MCAAAQRKPARKSHVHARGQLTESGGAPEGSDKWPASLAPAAARKVPWHISRSTSATFTCAIHAPRDACQTSTTGSARQSRDSAHPGCVENCGSVYTCSKVDTAPWFPPINSARTASVGLVGVCVCRRGCRFCLAVLPWLFAAPTQLTGGLPVLLLSSWLPCRREGQLQGPEPLHSCPSRPSRRRPWVPPCRRAACRWGRGTAE